MPKQLLSNKLFLLSLGLVAIIGLIFISISASQTSNAPVPTPTQLPLPILQAKTAKMPKPVQSQPVAGQIIVKFNPQYTTAQINEHLAQYHASIARQIEGINETVVKVPPGQEEAIAQQMKTDPYVDIVQRDYTTHAFFTPNDSYFTYQYALNNTGQSGGTAGDDIGAESAWNVTKGNGVKVAILDTGINLNQPDLAGKVIVQKSFVSSTVEDGDGHGTHVAGILAADTNNSVGVAGVCPGCQLIIGKVLDDSGSGTTSNAVAGITWAADQGAKVINMSLGTDDPSTESLYAQAVSYAQSKGTVVVAAAGNYDPSDPNGEKSPTTPNYPAAVPGVIAVAATTNKDQKASYSNYGSYVTIAAPGDNILSTAPTHSFTEEPFGYSTSTPYMYMSGTSMATPIVAGVAALVASTSYGTTPQAITNRLYSTADKISGTGTYWANGRVDAAQAVGANTLATTNAPSVITTPTIYCVGGSAQPPCATPPAGSSGSGTTPGGGGTNPSTAPNPSGTNNAPSGATVSGGISPAVSSSVSPSTSPVAGGTGNSPVCAQQVNNLFYNLASSSEPNSSRVHVKCEPSHGGGNGGGNSNPNEGDLSKFFQLLLQLLQLLIQLIEHCVASGTGAPTPSISPSLSTAPSVFVSSAPSSSSPTNGSSPTGTNSPTSAASPTTPVSSSSCTNPTTTLPMTSDPEAGITLGNYYLTNDTWNVTGYQVSQTMYICNYNNWYVVANTTDTGDGAIKTYPNVHEDFNEKPISSFNTITSSYADQPPSVGDYDVAYDIWVNGVATSGSTEVMIWTQALASQASAINGYQSIGTTTIDGVTYNVHENGNGYIALQAVPYNTSGTVDLKAVFNYLISKNIFPATSTLGQIDYGVEIDSTNGTNQTFKFTNFSITAN